MAKVSVQIPARQVGKAAFEFKVKDGDGRIVGHLQVRGGGVNWFSKGEQLGGGISWREFDALIRDYRNRARRR